MHYMSLLLLHLLFFLTEITAQTVVSVVTVAPPAPSTVLVATTLTSFAPDITVTVTPTGPASPQYTSQSDMIIAVLNSTNFYRWEHNASFLAWNASLAAYAANYSTQCIWAHSHGGPGENLARGYLDVTSAIDAWGDERSMYNYSLPTGFTEATGHFTQLVWKGTQTVGCAAYNCQGKNGLQGWYFVCEYWPQGNIVGQGKELNAWFLANVQSQVNSGQGFNLASATAGASGVGTSWASSVGLPTSTSNAGADTGRARGMNWRFEAVGGLIAFFGALGL